MNQLIAAKAHIRKLIRSRLIEFCRSPQRQVEQQIIESKIFNSLQYKNANSVSVYLSMNDREVSTDAIINDLLKDGSTKKCFVPKMELESSTIEMLRIYSKKDLNELPVTKVGSYSIPEPTTHFQGVLREKGSDQGLDLIITPGLGFDSRGGRLGKGKGYYDKYFAMIDEKMSALGRKTYKMGLAYSVQMVDKIPTGPKDINVDEVIFP
jgi:5-formyltetrahydrofolate cyclo-ligase